MAVQRLKRRTDFQAAAKGARAPASNFVLQARSRGDEGACRIGFTVSRQVGNAVERNRVRRRLREVVRLAPQAALCAGHDYVLIGRRAALDASFPDLVGELAAALRRIHPSGAAATPPLHRAGAPRRSRQNTANSATKSAPKRTN
jgi:ribonuclease P protein component